MRVQRPETLLLIEIGLHLKFGVGGSMLVAREHVAARDETVGVIQRLFGSPN